MSDEGLMPQMTQEEAEQSNAAAALMIKELMSVNKLAALTSLLAPGFGSNFPSAVKMGIMDAISPEFKKMDGLEQPREYHPEGDVLTHTARVIHTIPWAVESFITDSATEEDIRAYTRRGMLAAMFHDIGKPSCAKPHPKQDRVCFFGHAEVGAKMAREILDDVFKHALEHEEESGGNDVRFMLDGILFTIENHMKMHAIEKMRPAKREAIFASEHFFDLYILHVADCVAASVDFTPSDETKGHLMRVFDLYQEFRKNNGQQS